MVDAGTVSASELPLQVSGLNVAIAAIQLTPTGDSVSVSEAAAPEGWPTR